MFVTSTSRLLKAKRFLPLFITQFLGAFNDNAFKNAFIVWTTYAIADKQGIDITIFLALAGALFILPFLLFSSIAGQIADKYEKSRLVQIFKGIEILLMASCFIGFYWESLNFLLLLLFLMGTQSAFFGPIKYALLPLHLSKQELLLGNALIGSSTFTAILLGTLAGSLIVLWDHGTIWIFILMVSFAIIGWLSSLFIPKTPTQDKQLKINCNFILAFGQLIKTTHKYTQCWNAILWIAWFWFLGATILTQLPNYTKNVLFSDEQVLSALLSVVIIGMAIGAAICYRIFKGVIVIRYISYVHVLMTIGLFLFILFGYLFTKTYEPSLPLPLSILTKQIENTTLFTPTAFFVKPYAIATTLSLLFFSITAGFFIIPLYTLLQQHAPKNIISRIISCNNIVNSAFILGSALIIILLKGLDITLMNIFNLLIIVQLFSFIVLQKTLNIYD